MLRRARSIWLSRPDLRLSGASEYCFDSYDLFAPPFDQYLDCLQSLERQFTGQLAKGCYCQLGKSQQRGAAVYWGTSFSFSHLYELWFNLGALFKIWDRDNRLKNINLTKLNQHGKIYENLGEYLDDQTTDLFPRRYCETFFCHQKLSAPSCGQRTRPRSPTLPRRRTWPLKNACWPVSMKVQKKRPRRRTTSHPRTTIWSPRTTTKR